MTRQRVGFTGIKAMFPAYTGRMQKVMALLMKYL